MRVERRRKVFLLLELRVKTENQVLVKEEGNEKDWLLSECADDCLLYSCQTAI